MRLTPGMSWAWLSRSATRGRARSREWTSSFRSLLMRIWEKRKRQRGQGFPTSIRLRFSQEHLHGKTDIGPRKTGLPARGYVHERDAVRCYTVTAESAAMPDFIGD